MNIGGYFGLEIGKKRNDWLLDKSLFNSGRSACLYYLKHYKITELWIPYYICGDFVEYLKSNNISVNFYKIDDNFEITSKITIDSNLLYVNYLGIKDAYIDKLTKVYKNLIVDNSQALFNNPIKSEIPTFYSPRKFIGVPDGGVLFSDIKNIDLPEYYSYENCAHLLKQYDLDVESGYSDFRKNEENIMNSPMSKMSNLSKIIIDSLDLDYIKDVRIANFKHLRTYLWKYNRLNLEKIESTYTYPLMVDNGPELRKYLIENKVFTPTLWSDQLDKVYGVEQKFIENIVHLPIDQRYGEDEMLEIVKLIDSFYA